jgi:CCR4-NOT transcription complex subunit 2
MNGNSHQSSLPSSGAPQHPNAAPGVSPAPLGQANSTYATNGTEAHHPETPAQQILMSAADRWGLLGLLAMIKASHSDMDQGLTSIGTDLGAIGLDMSGSTYVLP